MPPFLSRGRSFVAVEVKSQSRFSTAMLAGLRAIGELPKIVRRVLVYRGSRNLKTRDGIDEWSVRSFVAALENDSLWP